ncbi:MAG: hypothetical protein DHS20C21_17550 [Gemmatimonadota bacterium]|nr:MAG: hypothetical protein DHS20C21_17550 [Gemmatimonadota bacterium]
MDVQVWISYALTLFILSFLYKDNPLYKLAEHLFVGISAGYYIALAYQETIRPNLWEAVVTDGHYWRIGAFLLSILMFTRYAPKVAWLSRWPLAFVVGMYAGINVIAFGSGDLIIQLQSTMLDFLHGGMGAISNLLLIVGLASSLLYFYFSREHTGALGVVSRIGVWFLMVSFGASFGYTVMSRISLAIGRTRDLMLHPLVTAALIVAVTVGLFVWSRRGGGADQEIT